MNKLIRTYNTNKYIIWIVILSFFLRLIGITHGYPFILNIDEPTMVRTTMGLFFSSDIDHFDWPHFSYYFHFPFYILFIKFRGLLQIVGLQSSLESLFPILWDDPFIFYTISRIISAVMGALAVIPTYFLGRRMFDKNIGLISALFIAISPYLISSSHYTMQDASILFWVMCGMYFSYRAVEEGRLRQYILAGSMFALASGVKYHAVLIALVLPLFILFKEYYSNDKTPVIKRYSKYIIPLIVSGISFLVLFLVTNYRVMLDWETFWSMEPGRGFLWQLTKNSAAVELSQYPSNLINRLWRILIDMGITISILSILSVWLISTKKFATDRYKIWPLIILSLFFILFTSRYERSGPRYFVSIYGMISILAGYTFINLINWKFAVKKARWFFTLIIFIPIIILSCLSFSKFVVKDTRREALDYYVNSKALGVDSYYVGNDMGELNVVNNLGIKKYDNGDDDLKEGEVVISQEKLEIDDKITLVDVIESRFYRSGPNFYVYQIN